MTFKGFTIDLVQTSKHQLDLPNPFLSTAYSKTVLPPYIFFFYKLSHVQFCS